MNLTINIKTDFLPQEVKEVVCSALEHEKHLAKYKIKSYGMICENFEAKYGFNSSALREKFEAGNLRQESDFLEWYIAKRELDHWSKKIKILSEISLKE